jgi:hypothetical protein
VHVHQYQAAAVLLEVCAEMQWLNPTDNIVFGVVMKW